MTSPALERDAAVAGDIADELGKRHRLTDDGRRYVEAWVKRRLAYNRVRSMDWKRPRCPFNLVVGQWLRAAADVLIAEEIDRRRAGGFDEPKLGPPPDYDYVTRGWRPGDPV